MSIGATSQSIADREEATRAVNDRRYAFYRMLRATDRVLWVLEELNCHRVRTLPPADRVQLRRELAGVPAWCMRAYRDSDWVQEVLDSVFDVQERLFARYVPDWQSEADESAEVIA